MRNAEVLKGQTVMKEPPPVKATIAYQEPLVLQLLLQAPAFLGLRVTPWSGGTIGPNTYRPKSAETSPLTPVKPFISYGGCTR